MASRQNEADYRPIFTPWGSITIAPSDTAVLSTICRKLYIGGPTVGTLSTVKVRMLDGSTPTFSVIPGVALDIQFDMVFVTGTTATLMVGTF
jgi:hypothetical protein